jgi:hypothetical protein
MVTTVTWLSAARYGLREAGDESWNCDTEAFMGEPDPAVIYRTEAIDRLREEFLKRLDGDTSICRYAAESGLFCRGFARYSDRELRQRYDWIARRRPYLSRPELEAIADRWQLARQEVGELPIACDVQQRVHDTCRGWDDFSNEDLSRFLFELNGKNVVVA